MKQKIFIIGLLFSVFNVITAQNSAFSYEIYVHDNDTLQYRLLMPQNFSETKEYPVVLFLHGAGERGDDNESQLVHGSKLFLNQMNRGAFPAIVIFPQCPKEDYWANPVIDRSTRPITYTFREDDPPTKSLSLVMALLDDFLSKPYVNRNKVYVGGLSMGGLGTYEILYRKPDMFAAAFAICGSGDPDRVKAYAQKTNLWVFHGANDDIVDPIASVNIAKAYLEAGGKLNFTMYENDNHNSWDSAFAEPNLLPWLFSKSKNLK